MRPHATQAPPPEAPHVQGREVERGSVLDDCGGGRRPGSNIPSWVPRATVQVRVSGWEDYTMTLHSLEGWLVGKMQTTAAAALRPYGEVTSNRSQSQCSIGNMANTPCSWWQPRTASFLRFRLLLKLLWPLNT